MENGGFLNHIIILPGFIIGIGEIHNPRKPRFNIRCQWRQMYDLSTTRVVNNYMVFAPTETPAL